MVTFKRALNQLPNLRTFLAINCQTAIFKFPHHLIQFAHLQDAANTLTQNHQRDIQWTTQYQISEKTQIWFLP